MGDWRDYVSEIDKKLAAAREAEIKKRKSARLWRNACITIMYGLPVICCLSIISIIARYFGGDWALNGLIFCACVFFGMIISVCIADLLDEWK